MFAASTDTTSLSSEAIAAAIFAGLLILGCIAWAILRQRAAEPHWTIALRHAMSEAGFRVSATWAEFTDWMKIGH
jgi:O-acetyl-ADP-ribose deacetylase (regulator of RNase III)